MALVEFCRGFVSPCGVTYYHFAPAYSRCTIRTVAIRNTFGKLTLTT